MTRLKELYLLLYSKCAKKKTCGLTVQCLFMCLWWHWIRLLPHVCVIRYLHRAIDPDAPPLAPQPKPSSPYRTVGCVFNHQTFLANCQPSDAVELCVFDFQVPHYQVKYTPLTLFMEHCPCYSFLIIKALCYFKKRKKSHWNIIKVFICFTGRYYDNSWGGQVWWNEFQCENVNLCCRSDWTEEIESNR